MISEFAQPLAEIWRNFKQMVIDYVSASMDNGIKAVIIMREILAGNIFSYYDSDYRKDVYFWGVEPNATCLKVLQFLRHTPPPRREQAVREKCYRGIDDGQTILGANL